LEELRVIYALHLLLVGKCVVEFLFAMSELLSLALTVEWSRSAFFKEGGSI